MPSLKVSFNDYFCQFETKKLFGNNFHTAFRKLKKLKNNF